MMKLKEGKIFKMDDTAIVLNHLKSRKTHQYVLNPRDLKLINDKGLLHITHRTNSSFNAPVRRCFLLKLFNWFKFPKEGLQILSDNTLVVLSNEILNSISSKEVLIDIEDDEALSIKSLKYYKISDLDIYNKIKDLKITKISKNDLITRFYTERKYETDPIPGDYFGFGLNFFNSETGFSSLKVEHFILRYTCSNGASSKIGIGMEKKYHFDSSPTDMYNFIEEKVNFSSKNRYHIIKHLNESRNQPSLKFIQEVQPKLSSILDGRDSFSFIKSFNSKLTKYDFFNYITDKAKSYDIYKRAQLEKLAGELILS